MIDVLLTCFFWNLGTIFISSLVGWGVFLQVYFRFDGWKKNKWQDALKKVVRSLNCNAISIRSKGNENYLQFCASDLIEDESKLREIFAAKTLYNVGVSIVDLFGPGAKFILILLVIAIPISILNASFGLWTEPKYLAFGGVLTTIGAILTLLTVTQFICLHFLVRLELEKEETGIPISSVIFRAKSIDFRPKYTRPLFRSGGKEGVAESNVILQSTDLKKRTLYIFVSVKNPSFSRRFFISVFENLGPACEQIVIVLVDRPYEENIKAELEGTGLEKNLDTLHAATDEKISLVNSVLKEKKYNLRVRIEAWENLAANVDPEIQKEVLAALNANTVFQSHAAAEAARVLQVPSSDGIRYLGFFKKELPELFTTYYASDEQLIDVYPGDNTPLIWLLEAGVYADELPYTTALAKRQPLVYCRVF